MTKSIHSTEYKKVIEKLRNAREDAHLTQTQAVNLLKKPQSYISKIERGERRVDIAELSIIAKVYGKKMSFFI